MTKNQALALAANALALKSHRFINNPSFNQTANNLLSRIKTILHQLEDENEMVTKAIDVFFWDLYEVIRLLSDPESSPTQISQARKMRKQTCNAIVELAKLADE